MTPIYYEHFEVGQISADELGLSFRYHERWQLTEGAFPLSLSMPLSDQAYDAAIITPWLVNLLPESQTLITVGRNLGVAPQDTLGLLDHIGDDLAGAVSVGRPRIRDKANHKIIDDEQTLETIINDLPAKPFLAGEEGVSMSLAGVQDKLPVVVIDGQMSIPTNGAPSTHILKPASERLYGSVQNEALCLILAKRCGLDAATVTTGRAGKRNYLLVTRYDRKEGRKGTLRIHQEDFCQALGKPPAAKYERNQTGIKGPTLADMFKLIDDEMTALDTLKMLNAVIFNVLICNTDAHAKNYSLLLSEGGPRLAPLYDLMCGAIWDGITPNMSQTIGGKNRGNHIYKRHWKRMAASCGLSETMVVERVVELANSVSRELPSAGDHVRALPTGDHPMVERLQHAIDERCQHILTNLNT
ncbi:MAG: type II toxin-antitoxin system HipA family toxin [Rhodospirillales bacterium]